MWEISRLVEIDHAAFKDPQNIAAVIGSQRFVMIWGEPSVTDHVARIFDSSKVLLTVLIDPGHFQTATAAQPGSTPGPVPKADYGKVPFNELGAIQNRIARSFGPVER